MIGDPRSVSDFILRIIHCWSMACSRLVQALSSGLQKFDLNILKVPVSLICRNLK